MPAWNLTGPSQQQPDPQPRWSLTGPGTQPQQQPSFGQNLGRDVGEIAGQFATALSHPMETAKGLGKLTIGMAEEFVPGQQQYETQYADPFYKSLGKDIGFKRDEGGKIVFDPQQLGTNIYEHPARLALDVAGMVAPFEGIPGKIGTAARVVNPLTTAGKAVSTIAKIPAKVAKYGLGETTGMGPRAIGEAYRTGVAGGPEAEAFRGQMRGDLDPNAPVDLARQAVQDLRQTRSTAYQMGMAGVQKAKPLNFQPIENAYSKASGIKTFRGKSVHPATSAVRDDIRSVLDEWKSDPGAHTVEGFDQLKQRLSDIEQNLPYGSPQRLLASRITNAVRSTIVKQAPEYAKVMKTYERMSNTIDELNRSLSLGKRASYDTALRKLQSILRNNVFTNYSARAKLAETIQKRAPELLPQLAGQAASSITPRGLPARLLTGAEGIAGITAAIVANPLAIIPLLGGLAASSPRLVGEAAHGLGRIKGAAGAIGRTIPTATKLETAATPRVEEIRQQSGEQSLRQLLSPQVYEHLQGQPEAKSAINRWLRSNRGESATKSLAANIARVLKVPNQYNRIYQEISNMGQ